ncbi:hypothetical protein [Novipirellula aureliae]|uniref:hypothetical protein n=1 Tax=Novipirellula aureliae TaxID=2527966 RepID=UPI0011B4E95E|nr:hypothetical protein [Novipirellula aureliae]
MADCGSSDGSASVRSEAAINSVEPSRFRPTLYRYTGDQAILPYDQSGVPSAFDQRNQAEHHRRENQTKRQRHHEMDPKWILEHRMSNEHEA